MIVQILINNQMSPIVFNRAIGMIIDNKNGLRIIGQDYKKTFPLEEIKSLMVVDNDK